MKHIRRFFFALAIFLSTFGMTAFASNEENGDTGGSPPSGKGSYVSYWQGGAWGGMRITVIDVTSPARLIDGTQWGKAADGTVSIDITGLAPSDGFFTRTVAGDGSAPLDLGSAVTHFGKMSKMAYRDGALLESSAGDYEFYTVPDFPVLMGKNQSSSQTIKNFINNEDILTKIAVWCGGGLTYENLTSGNFKLLVEPVMYVLIEGNKYAFTPTEAAMLKPCGDTVKYTFLNNTLANAFFLEYDELGWEAWTKSTDVKQEWDTITDYLGLHIYSPKAELQNPKSVTIISESDTGEPLYGAQFSVTGNGVKETVMVNGEFMVNLDGIADGTYTVTEITAPSGYELSGVPQAFTINERNISPVKLTFINTPKPPAQIEYSLIIDAGGEIKITQFHNVDAQALSPDNDTGNINQDSFITGMTGSKGEGFHD